MSIKDRFSSMPSLAGDVTQRPFQRHLIKRRERSKATQARLKGISKEPNIPGMTDKTRRFFRWKALFYLFQHDKGFNITQILLKRPFFYAKKYLTALFHSLLRGKSYTRDDDFFFYGMENEKQWLQLASKPGALLVLGFSYCHKPLECPSGRFNDRCMDDSENPVCQSCLISEIRSVKKMIKDVHLLTIPTVHAIGSDLLRLKEEHPDQEIIFMITACEMTLEMFGEFGSLASAKGIGVRLGGRICNTMKAFELSEVGIKPGLTRVLEPTKERIFSLLERLVEART